MSDFRIPVVVEERFGFGRSGEVVRFSVPLPRGLIADTTAFRVTDESGQAIAHQSRSLACWADRSVKWLLLDCLVDLAPHARRTLFVQPAATAHAGGREAPHTLRVAETPDRFQIDTGVATFEIRRNAPGPLSSVLLGNTGVLSDTGSRVELIGVDRQIRTPIIQRSYVEEAGALSATIVMEGELSCGKRAAALAYKSRTVFSAGSACVQVEILVRNPQPARHPGGLWDLGDAGSVFFEELGLSIRPAGASRGLGWKTQPEEPARAYEGPYWSLYQDSSGGERWNSRNHLDHTGKLSVSFQGYEVRTADSDAGGAGGGAGAESVLAAGRRATPSLTVLGERGWVAASVRDFWQNFPKALRWREGALQVGLFPGESRAPFELQGGEQKRHTVWLDFGLASGGAEESAAAQRAAAEQLAGLARLQCPLAVRVDPEWIERSRAIAYFIPRAQDRHTQYLRYIDGIIEGPTSFFAKRELIDEYGWRNFGDLYADHEAVKAAGPEPLVSHYNNQYDFIYGAAVHYLRSGEGRWRELMQDAARHTIDIDIYHTELDRPAYNGGLFWHTDHYKDAATCTHRTYSRANAEGASYGGGPSNEHNYTSGLLHYYYLTGDPEARVAVLGLADWAIAMDDGSRTLFGLFDPGPTGFASKTVSDSYHKPGRGAGNSINALLDAYSLCADRRYMRSAEELIQRCIHPADDIDELQLSEPERRWSYLVFLQVLGKYLDVKSELGELDYGFHYARDSLLHYADWMLRHEVPYRDVLHKVEIPTETWPAHDVRKCHILHLAARHAPANTREALQERAGFFFARCVADVLSFETAGVTRPLVLLSVYGHVQGYFEKYSAERIVCAEHNYSFGKPVPFIPQRERWKQALREKLQVASAESKRRWRDLLHGLKMRLLPPPLR